MRGEAARPLVARTAKRTGRTGGQDRDPGSLVARRGSSERELVGVGRGRGSAAVGYL